MKKKFEKESKMSDNNCFTNITAANWLHPC